MKTYNIRIVRDGKWWMVEIPDLDGLTQARRLGEAPEMAREWIALTTDAALDAVEVTVASVLVDGVDIWPKHLQVREIRRRLDQASEELSTLTREVAQELVASDVPVRDVGAVLEVSPQRVSQLVGA